VCRWRQRKQQQRKRSLKGSWKSHSWRHELLSRRECPKSLYSIEKG
jgi:hypothetical protein